MGSTCATGEICVVNTDCSLIICDLDGLSNCLADDDSEGFHAGLDCNDFDSTVFLGVVESCNGVDDDYNGSVDGAAGATTWYNETDVDDIGDSSGVVTVKNERFCILKVVLVVFVASLAGCDQVADDKDDAILQELKQIRALLEKIEKKDFSAQPSRKKIPKTAQLSVRNKPSLGDANAPVTIVEVSDYQCPYCKRFFDVTFPLIKKEYIDTGKVRLVFKDMPLGFHKNARKAAQSAHCAGEQGKYWEMHDILFQNTKRLDEKFLADYAKIIQLDANEFLSCLDSKRHLAAIDFDARQANQVGLTGTPSFVIGKTNENVIKGDVVRGAQSFAKIKVVIEKQLKLAAQK